MGPSKILERVKGIEPSSSAWKAVALPLSYTRDIKGLEQFSATHQAPLGHWNDSKILVRNEARLARPGSGYQ
jgi:hypothetical protein